MPLHLFDKPTIPGPTIHELLEGFWGGKPNLFYPPAPEKKQVWLFVTTYSDEAHGPSVTVYSTKEHALLAWWCDQLDTVLEDDDYFSPHYTPSEWLTDSLTELQQLRDDGFIDDGDIFTKLYEADID
jgi:hypothetical protein